MTSIELDVRKQIARISLSRPTSNILDFEMIERLSDALDQITGCPILILSSNAENFSLGVDVKIHTPELSPRMLQEFHEVIRKLYHFEGISIAVLNGYALGGGMELALVCDFIFAHKLTRIGFPEIRLACFPPVATILLPRKIGGHATKLLYTGETIEVSEAARIGLIESIFDENPEELIENIKKNSFSAMKLLKKTLRPTGSFDFDVELAHAEEIYLKELLATPDMTEGVRAFLEKRSARFEEH